MKYIITELQNAQSTRRGEVIEAANLTAAKRKASNMQMFLHTVMEIAHENGVRIAVKEAGSWTNL
jgi:D-mannonate dehydratase